MNIKRNRNRISNFIGWTICFDLEVTKPLEHIAHNYELTWDHDAQKFEEEELSFAPVLNLLIDELAKTPSYDHYHKFVDDELMASRFANEVIYLEDKRWRESKTREPLKPEDIGHYLEQHTIGGYIPRNLTKSVSSRIRAAQKAGVNNWDDLDDGHRKMLAELIVVILYISSNDPLPNGQYVWESDEDFHERILSN